MAKKNERSTKYQLSAESRKSSTEFGYASRLASVLKDALAPLIFDQYRNALHKRLQARITKAIGRGPTAKKGNRTLAEADVSMLKGLELNTHTNFSVLTHSLLVKVAILVEERALRIELSAIGPTHFRWPDRAQEAYLTIRCLVVDGQGAITERHLLEPLAVARTSAGNPPPRAAVKTGDLEDRMVLVAAGVSFFRTDSEGEDGLISHNRKYYAAQLVEAAYIKDGEVVVFADGGKKPPAVASLPVFDAVMVKWDADD